MAVIFTVYLEELKNLCAEYVEHIGKEHCDKYYWGTFGPTKLNPDIRISGNMKCFPSSGKDKSSVSGSGAIEISLGEDGPLMIYSGSWTDGKLSVVSVRTREVFVAGKEVAVQGKQLPYTTVRRDDENPGCTTHVKISLGDKTSLLITVVPGNTLLETPDGIGLETRIIAIENGDDPAKDGMHSCKNDIFLGSLQRDICLQDKASAVILTGVFFTSRTGCSISWIGHLAGKPPVCLSVRTEIPLNKFQAWLVGSSGIPTDFVRGLGIRPPFAAVKDETSEKQLQLQQHPSPLIPLSFSPAPVAPAPVAPAPVAVATAPIAVASITISTATAPVTAPIPLETPSTASLPVQPAASNPAPREPFFAHLRRDGLHYDGPRNMIMRRSKNGRLILVGMSNFTGGIAIPSEDEIKEIRIDYRGHVSVSHFFA